jgi:hypothetical protein
MKYSELDLDIFDLNELIQAIPEDEADMRGFYAEKLERLIIDINCDLHEKGLPTIQSINSKNKITLSEEI